MKLNASLAKGICIRGNFKKSVNMQFRSAAAYGDTRQPYNPLLEAE